MNEVRLRHAPARPNPDGSGTILAAPLGIITGSAESSPRCGKPVRRKEQGGIPVLEDPVCGRPEDHGGRCRSKAAVERENRAAVTRIAEGRRTGRYRRYDTSRDAGAAGWPTSRMEAA